MFLEAGSKYMAEIIIAIYTHFFIRNFDQTLKESKSFLIKL